MPETIPLGHERIPLLVGRWYSVRAIGVEAVVRLLMVDLVAEKATFAKATNTHPWRRMSQACRGASLPEFAGACSGMMAESFEPRAEFTTHAALGLGKRPLPAPGFDGRIAQLVEAHPDAAREIRAIVRHSEGRPIWRAEEVAGLTRARLGWILLGGGDIYGTPPAHNFEFLASAGGLVRRCRKCGIVDNLQGLTPRYCLAGDVEERDHA